MKLLRISSVPLKLVKSIILSENLFIEGSYSKALENYFNNFFATADAYVYELNKTGKCEANEVIFNHNGLQNLWMLNYSSIEQKFQKNQLEILKCQIDFYNPDVIFVNTNLFSFEQLNSILKRKVYIMAWDGFIKPMLNFNSNYDLVLTCLDSIAEKFRRIGTKSEVLDFGFDSRVLNFLDSKKEETLNFVGNLTSVHTERLMLLNALVDSKLDFNLYLGNYDKGINPFSRTILRELIQNRRWNYLTEIFKMQRLNHGGKYGLSMYQILNRATSTLNFHGDEVDKACNMRLFEATGLGTCLITDDKPGLEKFFKAGEEVVVFKNENDLIDKVKYLQNNPEVAQKIGLAGQKRVYKEHLWKHRVIELLEIINRNI